MRDKIFVSEFNSFSSLPEKIDLFGAFNKIQSGFYKSEIESMRYALINGKEDEYDRLKKELPSFTISGHFDKNRRFEYLENYTQIMSLDFDKLSDNEFSNSQKLIQECEFTMCSFTSPSGNGIKVFVKINSNKENHKIAFINISNYFFKLIGIEPDKACKDITRLCYYSYDPELYLNVESKVFDINFEINSEPNKIVYPSTDKIAKGYRNNYLLKVAGKLNRPGLSYDAIESALLKENQIKCNPPLPKDEVRSIAKSIIKYESQDPIDNTIISQPPKENEFYADFNDGIVKDLIKTVSPNTEASVMAMTFSFLALFGNYLGNKVYRNIGESKHHLNLFVCIVGPTSSGRKGESWNVISNIFKYLDLEFVENNIQTGLYSGEGLIHAVRNKKIETDKKTGLEVLIDKGVEDKRLLAIQQEFGSVFDLSKSSTNILSSVIRNAWDGKTLSQLIKNNKDVATNPHISIVAHITAEELKEKISRNDLFNGFANRFLWIYSIRTKELAIPKKNDAAQIKMVVDSLKDVINWVDKLQPLEIDLHSTSIKLYEKYYSELTQDIDGDIGKVTSRAAPNVVRLSSLLAVLDKSVEIMPKHLDFAMLLWRYCLKSADFIFGNDVGQKEVSKILIALNENNDGLSKKDLFKLFNNHIKKEKLDSILSYLIQTKKIQKSIRIIDNREIYFYELVRI